MTEDDLQDIETKLDKADPRCTAAVAFAAICRMGEIGPEAREYFAQLMPDAGDAEFFPQYEAGMDLLQSLSDGRFVLTGRCRICGCTEDRACSVPTGDEGDEEPCGWFDDTATLCDNPDCVRKAAAAAATAHATQG